MADISETDADFDMDDFDPEALAELGDLGDVTSQLENTRDQISSMMARQVGWIALLGGIAIGAAYFVGKMHGERDSIF